MKNDQLLIKWWLPCCLFILYSCAPKINFTALPATITKGDSVILNWTVSGKPTLMFDEKKMAHPPGDSLDLLEFTLSVQKGKKVRYIKKQITVFPKESTDKVVLITNDLHGDTLIASGTKDTILWKGFEIVSVSPVADRPLIIIHSGIESAIKGSGTHSNRWEGTPYAGRWEIMSLLTKEEKENHSLIPGQLEINVVVRAHKK